MTQINWNASEEERKLIRKVIDRVDRHKPLNQDQRLNITMTLTACHLNGCPLDFEKLLSCDTFTLFHDIVGIEDHINIETGLIERCFLPRCAA